MLEIKNLNKRYGSFYALRNLNLTVEDGELFGFVGANGAGKTTTMRICVGLLGADSGEVFIDGKRMLSNHRLLSNKVGYVPDFFGVYPSLTSMEYMQFFAASYGLVGTDADNLCMDLLRLVKLDHKADTDVNGLSRGMKQRLCLARGLVHNPDILFLDEPASGLDPRARYELKEILKNLSSMGKTIIISSHILPELSEMCTTIGIIDHGQMMLKGTIDEIHRAAAMQSPLIVVVEEHAVDDTFRVLQENPNVQHINARGNMIEVVFTGNKMDEAALLSTLVSNGIPILSFTRQEGSLEALFMQIINRSAQERRAGQNGRGRNQSAGPMGQPMGAPMGQPMGAPQPMYQQYGYRQPVNQTFGQQPVNMPVTPQYNAPRPMGAPMGAPQPMGQPMGAPQPMGQPMGAPQPMGQPMGAPQSMGQPMGQPYAQPMSQPVNQPMGQQYSQPMNQPVNQPMEPMFQGNQMSGESLQNQGGMRP